MSGVFYFSLHTPQEAFHSSINKRDTYYMNRKQSIFLLSLCVLTLWSCTPKVTEATTATEPKTDVLPITSDDPCAKFSDSKAGEAALDAHVIYRDYLRAERFDDAMPYWRKAFAAAPAADGKRKSHYTDGIKLYKNLMERATDEAGKNIYMDSIKYMQKRMGECFSEEPGYSEGLIAFDQYYQYRDMISNEEIFSNFKAAYNKMGMDAHAFVINPFTALLVEMYQKKEIEKDTALKYAKLVLDITAKNEHNKEDGWPIVLTYAPARLEIFEVEKGFYECEYFNEKYYPDFLEDPKNCDVIETVLSRLKWGDCDENGKEIQALRKAYDEHCRVVVTGTANKDLVDGKNNLENGNYQEAVECYQRYVDSQEDKEKEVNFYCGFRRSIMPI